MVKRPGDADPLSSVELELIDGYWRAANFLSVGQIYLLDNPLLRVPLTAEHVKPRLLGHWGTTPGLNFGVRPPARNTPLVLAPLTEPDRSCRSW